MKKFNPAVMQVGGIVLFSLLFKEIGFIMFVVPMMLNYNFLRLRAGWKNDTPGTIFPVWFVRRDAVARKFYTVILKVAGVVIGALCLMGWKNAAVAYLMTWWLVFIVEQAVAYLYIRRFNQQRRFTA